MREIKFRAWDKVLGKMVRQEDLALFNRTAGQILNRYSNVLQYTGLKDVKGVEIYEGDIYSTRGFLVESGMQTRPERRVVVEPTIESWYIVLCLMSTNNLEVIGNRYENPELLD